MGNSSFGSIGWMGKVPQPPKTSTSSSSAAQSQKQESLPAQLSQSGETQSTTGASSSEPSGWVVRHEEFSGQRLSQFLESHSAEGGQSQVPPPPPEEEKPKTPREEYKEKEKVFEEKYEKLDKENQDNFKRYLQDLNFKASSKQMEFTREEAAALTGHLRDAVSKLNLGAGDVKSFIENGLSAISDLSNIKSSEALQNLQSLYESGMLTPDEKEAFGEFFEALQNCADKPYMRDEKKLTDLLRGAIEKIDIGNPEIKEAILSGLDANSKLFEDIDDKELRRIISDPETGRRLLEEAAAAQPFSPERYNPREEERRIREQIMREAEKHKPLALKEGLLKEGVQTLANPDIPDDNPLKAAFRRADNNLSQSLQDIISIGIDNSNYQYIQDFLGKLSDEAIDDPRYSRQIEKIKSDLEEFLAAK